MSANSLGNREFEGSKPTLASPAKFTTSSEIAHGCERKFEWGSGGGIDLSGGGLVVWVEGIGWLPILSDRDIDPAVANS
jgi:hypothetical protein